MRHRIEEMLKDVEHSIFMIENHGERHDDAMKLNECMIQKRLLTELLNSGEVGELVVSSLTELIDLAKGFYEYDSWYANRRNALPIIERAEMALKTASQSAPSKGETV